MQPDVSVILVSYNTEALTKDCLNSLYEKTQGVTIIDVDGTVITTKIGDNKIVANGKMIEMDTTAKIINNRTYLPLRLVSEAFGFNVFWEQ